MALDKTIQFRADAQEKTHLTKAAEDSGMKLSAYLRAVALARTVVVVGESVGVVVIPATDSPTAQDDRIMAAVQAAVAELNSQAPSPPESNVIAGAPADSAPAQPGGEDGGETSAAGTPAPVKPDVVAADRPITPAPPSSPPATSPGGGEHLVGAGAPPAPIAAHPASHAEPQAAGVNPGPEETLKGDDALEPNGAGACPHCGGTNGRHQSFCEVVTGEPPVPVAESESDAPTPEGAPIESREQFLERRVREGENQLIAEAEWRQLTSSPPPPSGQAPATGMVACSQCGTTKSPGVPCPDCGAPPQ